MKAGIFDPYLDTIGGGERYCLTVAEALLKKNWQVDIFWPDIEIKKKILEKLALDIERVKFLPYSPRTNSLLNRLKKEREYDFLFYFSDGSIPFMFGRKNILHFQVPFKSVLKKSFKNTLKLKRIDRIVCNSFFTKKIIDERLGVNSEVIYPPVDVESIKPLTKEKIILSVGRFSQLMQNKRQDVLVGAFIEMLKEKSVSGWRLVLAGGSEIGGEEFAANLKKMAGRFPVEVIKNPSFSQLSELYGKAKIFWSASGFGVDEEIKPEKVEHFGITTVEAMAAGTVPVVLGKGGQKEIVESGKNGFWWQSVDELMTITLKLMKDDDLINQLSQEAIIRSRMFSKKVFYNKIFSLIAE